MKTGKISQHIIEGINYETGNSVSIKIVDGFIESITDISSSKNHDFNLFVAPGLIDNQINGYAGVDFSGKNLTVDDIIKATQAMWKEGVTTFLPTLLTNSHENLLMNLRIPFPDFILKVLIFLLRKVSGAAILFSISASHPWKNS